MANFLQKYFPPAQNVAKRKPGLPASFPGRKPAGALPNATIIYSVAASALFVVGLYSLLTGAWFNALLVLLLGGCLMGYAIYFLRNH